MEGRAAGGDYIASLLSSAPRLDLGVLGMLDGAAAGADGGEDCLERFCGDPGFAERAARLSSFSGQRFAGAAGLFGVPPPASAASNGEFAGSREASSVSDPVSAMRDANAKKRKAPAAAKGKGKESSAQAGEQKDPDAKRCKTTEGSEGKKEESSVKPKSEQAGSDKSVEDGGQKPPGKGKNAKPVEPPKDYVHVRARRGQATDSHSLAERVRRERISQRMKVLQDLVPGCNKVIGKALMLDEIINYVQSLQRQVEMFQACGPSASSVFSLESSSSGFPFSDQGDVFQSFVSNALENQCSLNPLDLALSQATNAQYAFQDGTAGTNLQVAKELLGGDLQNVFHIDNGQQSQENGVSAQSFHGR
ncbi:hypothetical protein HU200_012564 [Digitaria exilis]|uniref:BHLH domain-containing protein n=1 Tax=Digitaria exilis TaxID=1010633 RepID=A0A835FEP2_9POAL|nr:hypothetical protein HU200_012564 [Digitaria exilis]